MAIATLTVIPTQKMMDLKKAISRPITKDLTMGLMMLMEILKAKEMASVKDL